MFSLSLPLIAASVLAFIIIVYVILDGFDLGIGILFPYVTSEKHRDDMMNSVAPVWDGNETWLVFGGSMLYGAFPKAYSTLLPTLYIPLFIMLAALVFRGVAFEFRFKSRKTRIVWDSAFAIGSTLATFCQGLVLGTFVQGYQLNELSNGASYVWLTPFSLLSGIALVFGYALLGATWLIGKTTHDLQERMFSIAKILLPVILIFIGIVSLWTPLISEHVFHRWFTLPNTFYLAPLPVITLFIAVFAFRALVKRQELSPFYLTISVFLLCYIGFCISAFPYIIPYQVTLWQAASNKASLLFLLIGVSILLPVLIGYSLHAYRVFSGKISSAGYH